MVLAMIASAALGIHGVIRGGLIGALCAIVGGIAFAVLFIFGGCVSAIGLGVIFVGWIASWSGATAT